MSEDVIFRDALAGLHRGDFSRIEPFFSGEPSQIVEWHKAGRFQDDVQAVAEALTCACFLGHTKVAEYLLTQGVDPSGGIGTGLNAIHWAANRGQLESVRLLLQQNTPLETRSMYGGTALGTAVWSAIHESKPDHPQIIEALLEAGARIEEAEYPSGNDQIDAILKRHGAV